MNPTHRNPTNVCEQRYVFEFPNRAGRGPSRKRGTGHALRPSQCGDQSDGGPLARRGGGNGSQIRGKNRNAAIAQTEQRNFYATRNYRTVRLSQRLLLAALPSNATRQTETTYANRANRQPVRHCARTDAHQNASHARSTRPDLRESRTDPIHALRNPAPIVLRRAVKTAR